MLKILQHIFQQISVHTSHLSTGMIKHHGHQPDISRHQPHQPWHQPSTNINWLDDINHQRTDGSELCSKFLRVLNGSEVQLYDESEHRSIRFGEASQWRRRQGLLLYGHWLQVGIWSDEESRSYGYHWLSIFPKKNLAVWSKELQYILGLRPHRKWDGNSQIGPSVLSHGVMSSAFCSGSRRFEICHVYACVNVANHLLYVFVFLLYIYIYIHIQYESMNPSSSPQYWYHRV